MVVVAKLYFPHRHSSTLPHSEPAEGERSASLRMGDVIAVVAGAAGIDRLCRPGRATRELDMKDRMIKKDD